MHYFPEINLSTLYCTHANQRQYTKLSEISQIHSFLLTVISLIAFKITFKSKLEILDIHHIGMSHGNIC